MLEGVLSALDYKPVSCGEQFNLGLGSPVSVPHMVQLLQTELKSKAIIVSQIKICLSRNIVFSTSLWTYICNFKTNLFTLQKKLPLPPTEIIQTWADISESRKYLHFNPTTSLTEGLIWFYTSFCKVNSHFCGWYNVQTYPESLYIIFNTGIRQFALWFRGYRNRRRDEIKGIIPWPAGEWFKRFDKKFKNILNKYIC